jgi:hypothetical protein
VSIHLSSSYYASLCWYGLKKLGFTGGEPDPGFVEWSRRLSELGGDFAFAAPLAGGPVFNFVYQIPGYLDPAEAAELGDIVRALEEFIQTKSVEPFARRWPARTAHWEKWYLPGNLGYLFGVVGGREKETVRLIRLFLDFIGGLWPAYRPEFEEKLRGLPLRGHEERCRRLDPVEAWEKELGLPYPYDRFELVICPESRTVASSLGPEKVVFGAAHAWPLMRNAVVHEIGVRMISFEHLSNHPATRPLMERDYLGVLKLIETEICFRKPRLLPDLTDDPFIRSMRLEKLVEWRTGKRPGADLAASLAEWHTEARALGLI